MTRVLVIGGYGNFGAFIVRRLAREPGISVIVAGRSEEKAKAISESTHSEWMALDIERDLDGSLKLAKADIVIHTSGPFQEQDYAVAQACVRHGAHYIDLSDGRSFVANIGALEHVAKAAGVLVVSGASSVPALTSAIVDAYMHEFEHLDTLDYGIATAQKTNRGLATTRAVLGYAGKPFETLLDGQMRQIHGWQDITWRKFAYLGWRALGNCDVPDLSLFPTRYPSLQTIRFRAGIEVSAIHLSLWALTWFVRWGFIGNLATMAASLLALSRPFDAIGTSKSGFFMEMRGRDKKDHPKKMLFELTACSGDGAMIPCTPAIVLALKLARGEMAQRGARPCVGLLTLDELLQELKSLDISWTMRAV